MSMILLAFPGEKTSKKIRSILMHKGFDDVRIMSSGGEALRELSEHSAGLIICPVRMRDMDYTELIRRKSTPFYDVLLMDSAKNIYGRKEEDVVALTAPIKLTDLISTVDMMLSDVEYAYSQEKKKKKREKERLRAAKKRSPEEQMILDNAKAYLMERNHLSEEEAFRYIQKNSMDMGRSMVETAQMILMF